MGRLDKFYSDQNISLNEETDLSKLFKQILEETGVDGPFRIFLEEHCSDNWQKIFHCDCDKIRKILKAAITQTTFKEQVITFIRGFEKECSYPTICIYTMPDESGQGPPRVAPLLTFAKDVANKVFPNDPLEFSRCFDYLDRMNGRHFLLSNAQWFYGKDFFLKPEFVRSMDEETVWHLFETLFDQETNQDKSAFVSYLEEWNNTNRATFAIENFRSLQLAQTFLGIQINQKSAEASFDCLNMIERLLQNREYHPGGDHVNGFYKWIEAVRREFEVYWCLHISEEDLPPALNEEWATRYHRYFLLFIPDQSQAIIHAMIKWSLTKDLEKWMREEKYSLFSDRATSGEFGPLWYVSPYGNEWLKAFYDFLSALPIEQRLLVLSKRFGSSVSFFVGDLPSGIILPKPDTEDSENYKDVNEILYSYRVQEEDINNYDLYFKRWIESKTLPKDIFFRAAIKGVERFCGQTSFVVKHSNIILGQLRGFVAANDVPVPFEELDYIWRAVEEHEPQKALFHRLMLLRASEIPCCDEKLETNRSGPCPLTIREIVRRLSVIGKDDSMDDRTEDIRRWFAEYCISRLQLRKKERADKDGYRNDQVMETSPIWREGYLHALSELGTDLGGRIHKLAHFIKKHDPNSDVRDTATKCYKASRRKHIKREERYEILRSLIAAYWWLLMAHIAALGKEPDHEGALLTRRRQLRR